MIGTTTVRVPAPIKLDTGKDEWHLLPNDALRGIGKVFTFGAQKYEPDGYLRGADWSRYYNAAMRHMTAWWDREPGDSESQLSHLFHAGACVLILAVYELRGIGNDDRPRPPTGG